MLRKLFHSDIYHLLRIEQSVHIAPWTEETFNACLHAGYLGWVIEQNQQQNQQQDQQHDQPIIGFILVSLTLDECHILNLCVNRESQRQGFGQKLLEHALNHARQQGVRIAYLEVRRSNLSAISLYQKMKFQLIGQRKNYYPTVTGQEDALILAINLRPEASVKV